MSRYPYLPVIHTDDDNRLEMNSFRHELLRNLILPTFHSPSTIVVEDPMTVVAREEPKLVIDLYKKGLETKERMHYLDVASSLKQKRDDVLSQLASDHSKLLAQAVVSRPDMNTFEVETETPFEQSLFDRVFRMGTRNLSLKTTLKLS
jgi:hypothetical protein